ncbi:MAG: response regulator [Archangiaceae bacterium]|nr:response regulator [Archangiaceae bacterium]
MAQRTILISDDDPKLVSVLSRLALAGGFAVIPDLQSNVVALAEEHHPTLIILDMNQRIDGRILLGALRRHPRLADIPVVVLSGDDSSRDFCLALGATDFELKPFGSSFIRRIGEWMRLPTWEAAA